MLRDYQQECRKKVLEAYNQGENRLVVVLPTGCHQKGQGILMYDGTIKKVEDVQLNDLLMGPDSLPRKVLKLYTGAEEMFQITPVKGTPWIVNRGHILSLTRTNQRNKVTRIFPSTKGGGIYDVPLADWLNWSKYQKHIHKLFRVGVNFPTLQVLPLNPYLLGVILGDGGLSIKESVSLTNIDIPTINEVKRILEEMNLFLNKIPNTNRTQSYRFAGRIGKGRPKNHIQTIQKIMRNLDLLPIKCENRFIPHIFKVASRSDRLNLLAGLLDTDGHLSKNDFEYVSKSFQLASDITFVARSVGLAAYISKKIIKAYDSNGVTYYRVHISGECSIIPTRLIRKQAHGRKQVKNVLRTGFSVSSVGHGQYYGFKVDRDSRYLLDDFTVTHNSGKTYIFAHLISEFVKQTGKKALVLAHRGELLVQAQAKLERVDPTLKIEIEKAEERADHRNANVIVASVQTLGQTNSVRIARFDPKDFAIVLIDECHHANKSNVTYSNILRYFGMLKSEPTNNWNKGLLLGVTATPSRHDNEGIDTVFDKIVYNYEIVKAIQEGWLCRVKAWRVDTDIDISKVGKVAGDFNAGELSETINNSKRNGLIVKTYLDKLKGKKTLCFAVDVDHTKALYDTFTEHGVKASYVVGDSPPETRREKLHEFAHGDTDVMVNCMVLTEGYDNANIEGVLMARPTQSGILFRQMAGRGLRVSPGKGYLEIIDFTDNTFKHRLQTTASLLGLPGKVDFKGEDILNYKEDLEQVIRNAPDIDLSTVDIHKIKYLLREVNLLGGLQIPEALREITTYDWYTLGEDCFKISLPEKTSFTVRYDATGNYEITYQKDKFTKTIYKRNSLKEIIPWLDTWIKDHFNNKLILINTEAKWRKEHATEKQLAFLQRVGYDPVILASLNKGTAAQLITRILNKHKSATT